MMKATARHPLALLPPPPAASPTARPLAPCRRCRLPEAMGGASDRPPSLVSTHWPAVAARAKDYGCCVSDALSDMCPEVDCWDQYLYWAFLEKNQAGDYGLRLFRFHPATSCGLLPAPRADLLGRKLGRFVLCWNSEAEDAGELQLG